MYLAGGGSPAGLDDFKATVADMPVFCVSSAEAQKLEGRSRGDGQASTFAKCGC